MSYLKFDKKQLVNLEYSLQREILQSNRAGSYSCTTLSGCNTRKYHGLLVCPNNLLDGCKHVLLSSLDATVIQHDEEFNLGLHKFSGENYEPRGHKYIRDFEAEVLPVTTYRVGGVVLTMERLLVEKTEQLLTRYTLVEANSPTKLRFKPFLAFRNVHQLSRSNLYVNTRYKKVQKGISLCLYDGYPDLYLQFSSAADYVHNPDWYYNIEYFKEKARGYEFLEDLFVPGYFELEIEKGESIIISAATFEAKPAQLSRKFNAETQKKTPRSSFFGCLQNSAEQFFVKMPEFTDIQAGYPWYNGRINQTFVALPGLSLAIDNTGLIKQILKTNIKRLKNGLFPVKWGQFNSDYNSADAPLWFFWSVQQLIDDLGGKKEVWKQYKKVFSSILDAYKNGTDFNVHMQANGLISAYAPGVPLTWMNARLNGQPVSPRYGNPVEVNALWFNALSFSLEMAHEAGDDGFVAQWEHAVDLISTSFLETFWDNEKAYLADYSFEGKADWSIRPNQVIAASMKYSPLTKEMRKSVLSTAKNHLLTSKGLRTLSPRNPKYIGVYEGNEAMRENAMHQGSVFPWLIGFFIEAYLLVHGRSGLSFVKKIMDGFEEEMVNGCIGSVSELYSGNPPHVGKGAVSQAWNIGEILRAYHIIHNYSN
jgi:predicted glycogen debranching enzyme